MLFTKVFWQLNDDRWEAPLCSLIVTLQLSFDVFLQGEGAQEAEVSPDSDEYMVTLLTQIGVKLQVLRDELKEKDLAPIKKEMEEEEVSQSFMTPLTPI